MPKFDLFKYFVSVWIHCQIAKIKFFLFAIISSSIKYIFNYNMYTVTFVASGLPKYIRIMLKLYVLYW